MLVGCATVMSLAGASGQKVPVVFSNYLKPDEMVRGQVVIVVPPGEIKEYVEKVELAAQRDPEWFKEYSRKAKPGVPLPFHEKLGLSKKEYSAYNELWDQRKVTPVKEGNVAIRLEQTKNEEWMVRVMGRRGARISLLKYRPEDDTFKSPNGEMKRLADIDADPRSILGKWTGHEWKFEEEDGLGKTKENFAIGKLEGTNYGLLVYRLQSTLPSGRPLPDSSIVIRFPLAAK